MNKEVVNKSELWIALQMECYEQFDAIIREQLKKAIEGDTDAAKFIAEFVKPYVFNTRAY